MASEGPAHHPVMAEEALSFLAVRPGGLYIDATFGSGGHSARILALGGRVLGIDRDPETAALALEGPAGRFADRLTVRVGDYRDLSDICATEHLTAADGILADLGLSSLQLDDPGRGFSFSTDGPLDMRMDRSRGETAGDLVRRASEGEIRDWLSRYGDERRAGRIARAIARERDTAAIDTTARLRDVVLRALPRPERRGDRIHPATRTFMALRIAVNRELEGIERFFDAAGAVLAPGGRLVVISFHSGEDREVKTNLRRLSGRCQCPRELPECRCGAARRFRILTGSPMRPGAEEALRNPRARSARLRAAERLAHGPEAARPQGESP